jgi:adenosylhomocysteine nucleosidase
MSDNGPQDFSAATAAVGAPPQSALGCGAVIGVVAAFKREVSPLLRMASKVRRLGRNRFGLELRGVPTLLSVSGAGAEHSFRAARELARKFPLQGLISLGFAAGLEDSLAPGALLVAEEVIEESSGERFSCETALLPSHVGSRGALLSVPAVLQSAVQKRRLGRHWNAVAADMESAGVARAAREAGLPFAALKSVTDSSDESIAIDFQRCQSEHGELSSWRVVWEAATSLQGLRDLIRLAGASRRAARNLALGLGSS